MNGNGNTQRRTQRHDGICIWCNKRFQDADERQLHVSLLGAPGQFHKACFDEYESSTT